MQKLLQYAFATLLFLESSCAFGQVRVESPNREVAIDFLLDPLNSSPLYQVTFRGEQVIKPSALALKFPSEDATGGFVQSGPVTILNVESAEVREDFEQVTGKRRQVHVVGNKKTIRLEHANHPQQTWNIAICAFDDGVAFRYEFPKDDGQSKELVIVDEATEFAITPSSQVQALPLKNFTTSYETRYQTLPANQLPKDSLLALPLLFELPSGSFAAITESDVDEYAGMYLQQIDNQLTSRLSPLPAESSVAVRTTRPHTSPWRVILLAKEIGRLVESDLVLALAQPCQIADTSWVKSGKTTFPWWNGFYESGVDFKPGLNTETAKHYIDFCAEAGIPYHSLDGVGNSAWYGGPIVPYQGAEPTKGIDGLDLQAVLAYAKSKGVRIRLWMNWKAAEKYMETAFPQYEQWGIEGVMLDFMDRDDQLMNAFVRRAVALAARHHLSITLHGCPKPTGLERAYPNLLTHEGVMNLEYDKWDKTGVLPEYEVTVPFTRMLAGPLDFHQGSFRTVKLEDFKPQMAAPLVIGTPSRTLASYVVYQNHLSMVADYPSAYRGHPGIAALAAIPTTWDDTRVLSAKLGQHIVIARRSSDDWHIGAMTDRQPRTLDLDTKFLGEGNYRCTVYGDDESKPFGLANNETELHQGEKLQLKLSAAGGAYVRIQRLNAE